MKNKHIIQVFEYQKLRYGDDEKFKKHHFEAMVLFNEKNKNKYFTPIHKGIQFKSYVGIVQIGGLTLEILPKADKGSSATQGQEKLWQGVLLNMLSVCKKINVDRISEASLKRRHNSILEVYFEMYLTEIESLIQRGLIKQYRHIQSNQKALKGKLVFSKNIQRNAVHKERFYCEHQVYDRDHTLHLILLKGLKVLDALVDHHLRDKLNRTLFAFEGLKEIYITAKHFESLSINRKSQPYRKAIEIAKMLILNYAPDLTSGKDNMLTLLFDMNKLWEEYIYRILYKYKPADFEVSFQNSKDFWENKTIRPDIVITTPEGDNLIIDTKWKIPDSSNPNDNDLKQMFAYNLYWNTGKSMLLYPKTAQDDSSFGVYHPTPSYQKDNKCKLGFVGILENNQLRGNEVIAKDIFGKLMNTTDDIIVV